MGGANRAGRRRHAVAAASFVLETARYLREKDSAFTSCELLRVTEW
jgi:hypothetical protein